MAHPRPRRRWNKLHPRRLTVRIAALAGPVTHIPGIFYLIAINTIIAYKPGAPGWQLEVLTYNVIWFAIPLCALAVCIVAPEQARWRSRCSERWFETTCERSCLWRRLGSAGRSSLKER